MKIFKSSKPKIDYESLFYESQQKLSWYKEALETKQIQCDTIESVVLKLRQENQQLKKELDTLKKSLLDLPKILGKNLGK